MAVEPRFRQRFFGVRRTGFYDGGKSVPVNGRGEETVSWSEIRINILGSMTAAAIGGLLFMGGAGLVLGVNLLKVLETPVGMTPNEQLGLLYISNIVGDFVGLFGGMAITTRAQHYLRNRG